MTAATLVAKVRLLCGEADPVEATCWFIACRHAAFVLSEYRVKDLARDIVDGRTDGPLRTEADIAQWVTETDEAEEGDWSWLDEELSGHFGR